MLIILSPAFLPQRTVLGWGWRSSLIPREKRPSSESGQGPYHHHHHSTLCRKMSPTKSSAQAQNQQRKTKWELCRPQRWRESDAQPSPAQPCACGGLLAFPHSLGRSTAARSSGELNSCWVHHLQDSGILGRGIHSLVPLTL